MDMCKDVSLAGSFHHLRWSPSLSEGGNRYAHDRCYVLFRAYTRKGVFCAMAKVGTITKSKILPLRAPYGFDCVRTALRSG